MSTVPDPRAAKVKDDPFHIGWRYVPQKGPDGVERVVQVPLTEHDLLFPQEEDFYLQNPDHDLDCDYLRGVLARRVAGVPGAIVYHDMRIDFGVEGLQPLGPDLSLFFGAPASFNHRKATLMVAELGLRSALALEVTSPSTRDTDLNKKVLLYERAGVELYVIVNYRNEEPDPADIEILAYRATPAGFVRVEPNECGWSRCAFGWGWKKVGPSATTSTASGCQARWSCRKPCSSSRSARSSCKR